ncbi:mechanosensitive ion channel family protein [Wenzhouxiangella sediminis]|uniref:Mechanosensitive ion channel family protein n=1 Tax=Wenzhouxiangella sediminis TaxID=1792836 RepID=A0A3E1K5A9_9GAMM|nr:mechanosensitive ion channel domain-containing protein [Wenzhouxiangella sediminis]RFF29138.1 mechanosensitive ion channel family protein [Wenzhouxiangella sediminis]
MPTSFLIPVARLAACLLLLAATFVVGQTTPPERWFEVESLNAGLGEAPAELERSTPRQTVSHLLVLTDEGNYETAAHLLNLNELPEDEQGERGPELARKLAEVINRTMVIDWGELPSRSDALLERSGSEAPLAGQARRSIELSFLELQPAPAEIRVNRIKPAEGEAVWVFATQTVDDIDALYDRYGPGWLEERLPDTLQRPAFAGTRIWEWLALPITVGLLVLLGWLTHSAIGWIGRAVPIDWINRAAGRMRLPLAVALMALLGQFLTGWVISFSGFFYTVLSPLLIGLTIVGLTLAILRTIDATLEKVTERFVDDIDDSSDRDRRKIYTSIYALRRFVLLAAVLISGMVFLVQLRLFDNVGMSLLASAGVITVVLGIAGRTVLGNILASLQIAIAKPIRIGDAVKYEDYWGYVESIYYTFLVLRTWDGRRLIVPVQYFISYPFENWSMVDASVTRTVTLRLDHSAEPDKLRKAFEKLVAKNERALEDEFLMTAVSEVNEDFQEVTFYATAGNPTDAWLMQMDLREGMTDWVRRYHPEWWPSDRILLDRPDRKAD